MSGGGLDLWVLYDHPRDFPDWFVARRFVNDQPTPDFLMAHTLEALRDLLPPGLAMLARSPSDDPVILESWL